MTLDAVRAELAPRNLLRVAINLSNFLLVTGRDAGGNPTGVAPDMGGEIARHLGVDMVLVPYPDPGALADAVVRDEWDIGLIGAEPARAQHIAFTPAYVEIDATYLVPNGSAIHAVAAVDRPGIRIAVTARTAYDLWLERNLRHATLVRSASFDTAFDEFSSHQLDALAGLRSRLLVDARKMPDSRLLDGRFAAIQQAIGTPRSRQASAVFLSGFVENAKNSGLITRLIERHGVIGLSVAPVVEVGSAPEPRDGA
ncbi:transporter substrate-binding domain-containing protein [Lichenicola sp.]|uniref:transporter substrate-binding domain-containing protein n=1 Tax=Lichenicola sp. TaxID=2804529 RepID=UPI003B006D2D